MTLLREQLVAQASPSGERKTCLECGRSFRWLGQQRLVCGACTRPGKSRAVNFKADAVNG